MRDVHWRGVDVGESKTVLLSGYETVRRLVCKNCEGLGYGLEYVNEYLRES